MKHGKPNLEDVRNAVKKLADQTNNGYALAFMQQVTGADSFSDIKPGDFAKLIAACDDECTKSNGSVRASARMRGLTVHGDYESQPSKFYEDQEAARKAGEEIPPYHAPLKPGSPEQERLFEQMRKNNESLKSG